ncbi:PqqD family protein [Actinoplanes sp. NPDC051859]|uniref:PqqD family protein n=1 Tax=Actinoplanes sp. NPDC051859 TaxID=3363909 RepID=UPI0037B894F8
MHISESVVWQETNDSISIYHTESGKFRTLNETAAKIWLLVDGNPDRESVRTQLGLLYGSGNVALTGRIRIEVDRFINGMVEAGLFIEDDADRAGVPLAEGVAV